MRSNALLGLAAFGTVASAFSLPANLKTIYDNHKVSHSHTKGVRDLSIILTILQVGNVCQEIIGHF